ncbi:MAG: hypothetical protein AAFN10_10890 [Bacteroidota bacterium]
MISLLLIGFIYLAVDLSDVEQVRSPSTNLYISLSLMSLCLFGFLTWGLYSGKELIDNFPKLRKYDFEWFFKPVGSFIRMDAHNLGESIIGILVAVIFWFAFGAIFLAIALAIFLLLSYVVFVILTVLYRLFFRGLAWVLSMSEETEANLNLSILYSFGISCMLMLGGSGLIYLVDLLV